MTPAIAPRRTHISPHRGPLTVESREQQAEPGTKPKGLWYEVNADWRRWCRDEMPHWVAGRHLHRVVLDGEHMLEIRSVAALDAFYAEYGVSEKCWSRWSQDCFDMDRGIRWADVARRYDGIEIAPYLWQRRLDGPSWYYSWDCASGVIWRPRGVRVERMRRLPGTASDD